MSNYENRMQRDLVTDAIVTESNEEFILPDYMPEIGRVLRVSATLLPDEPFPETGGTEFSGKIEYRLLYGDGEGNITEAPLEGRYRYRLQNPEARALTLFTEERIETVGARPTAPRKLGIRTRIYARPHLLVEEEIGVPLTALVGEGTPVERVEKEIKLLHRNAFASGLLHAEGSFTVEDAPADTLSLLSVQSAFLPEEKTARDGYLSVRGRLIFTLLLKKEGELPSVKVCTIPVEEEIPTEGARFGDAVALRAFLSSPAITLEEEGENTTLLIDAEYSLSCVLSHNQAASVLEDLYIHSMHHDIVRKPLTTEALIGCASGNFTVGAECALPADFSASGCLFPSFALKEATVSHVGEKAIVVGTLTVHLLSFGSGEVGRCELALPFRTELALGGMENDEKLSLFVCPVGGNAQASEGGVRLSTELAVDVTATRPLSLSLPSALIKKGDILPKEAPTVTLYYPCDSDTLWSVGKRYGVPLSLLKQENGMPEDEDATAPLDGYAYLFVNKL